MSTDPQQPAEAAPEGPAGSATAGGTSAGAAAMHGHLMTEPRGFWAEAWHQVLGRPGAIFGLSWIGIVAFFAVFSPLLANGHPLIMWTLDDAGERVAMTMPLFQSLSSVDVLLIIGGIIVPIWIFLPLAESNPRPERVLKALAFSVAFSTPAYLLLSGWAEMSITFWLAFSALFAPQMYPQLSNLAGWPIIIALPITIAFAGFCFAGLLKVTKAEKKRSDRLLDVIYLALLAGAIAACSELVAGMVDRPGVSDFVREMERSPRFIPIASALIAAFFMAIFALIPMSRDLVNRLLLVLATGLMAGSVISQAWQPPDPRFDYVEREQAGQIETVYTIIPLSPYQRQLGFDLREPGEEARPAAEGEEEVTWPLFLLGSDGSGQDVLAQLLHACRLSISIGLVATGIAAIIGVTLGALMGYFGGWVDLLLYRVVEIFMAVPLLFLLIVAAAVLPRNIYVMMAIIGCFTWTSAARFTRAEFLRLRDQDFVQAARALGLPMRSVLFRHMLPNGVTPVLVEASFAVAAAILFETILSYLGLGPADQASWGQLLSEAFSDVGQFIWWLAIFPGFAIFLTVLSLTLFGEAMRDAIDP